MNPGGVRAAPYHAGASPLMWSDETIFRERRSVRAAAELAGIDNIQVVNGKVARSTRSPPLDIARHRGFTGQTRHCS
jgi:hypothetical protein